MENKEEATWQEVIQLVIGIACRIASIVSLITALGYHFAGDDRDVASAAWYLAVALWLKMCSENISPAD